VNGVSYEVDVEVLEDDGAEAHASYHGLPPSTPSRPAPAPAAAPAAAPAPAAASAPAAQPAAQPAAPAGGGGEGGSLPSPIAGIVVEVKVAVGDTVSANDTVVVLEAMKMNTNVAAGTSGKVKSIAVKPGEAVKQSQVLMTFE
jgi:biotin carboxyl carrier protein